MSTRANIIIQDQHDAIQLYRHSDGYPESDHGVLAGLKEAMPYAWTLPRMEATDFAAAIVRAWKDGGGNIHIDGTADLPGSLHGDIDYYYIITPAKGKGCWEVRTFESNGDLVSTTDLK